MHVVEADELIRRDAAFEVEQVRQEAAEPRPSALRVGDDQQVRLDEHQGLLAAPPMLPSLSPQLIEESMHGASGVAANRIKPLSDHSVGKVSVSRRQVLQVIADPAASGLVAVRPRAVERNYCRGRIGELVDYGLRPLVACADLPQKYIPRAALVLSERADQASG